MTASPPRDSGAPPHDGRELATFYALAFAISWAGWIPALAASRGVALFAHRYWSAALLLPALGPAIAARLAGRQTSDIGRRLRELFLRRVPAGAIALAVIAPPAIFATTRVLAHLLAPGTPAPARGAWGAIAFASLLSALSNPFEEIGWRGFALPRLQSRIGPVAATLVVGVLWALWHLPIFAIPAGLYSMAAIPFGWWLADVIARSFVLTWLVNRSRGGVLAVSIYHVLANVSALAIGLWSYPLLAVVEGGLAVFVIARAGPSLGRGRAMDSG